MKHNWITIIHQPGHKRQKCKRCGATRDCYNISVKTKDHWTPAIKDDKRKPLCNKY